MSLHAVDNGAGDVPDDAAGRADSPLLGFEPSSSGDPLHFPSPYYTRALPREDAFVDRVVDMNLALSLHSAHFYSLCQNTIPLPSRLPYIYSDQCKALPLPPAVIPGLHRRASALSLRKQTSALSLRQCIYHPPAAAGLATPYSVRNAVYIDSEPVAQRLSALIAAASPEEDPESEPLVMAPLSRPSLVPEDKYPHVYVPPSSRSQSRSSHDSTESSPSPLFTTRKLSSMTVSSAAGDTLYTSPASASFEYAEDVPGVAAQPDDKQEYEPHPDINPDHPIVVTDTVACQAPPMASRWSLATSLGGTESISTTTAASKEKKGKEKRFTSFMPKLSIAPPLPNGNAPVMMVSGRWQDLSPGLGAGAAGRSSLSLRGSSSGEFIPLSPSGHRFKGGLVGVRQDASSLSLATEMQAFGSPYKTRVRTTLPTLMESLEDSDEVPVLERTSSSSNDVDGSSTTRASVPTSAISDVSTVSYRLSLSPVSIPSLSLYNTHARAHSRTQSQCNGRVNAAAAPAHPYAHASGHFNNADATVNLDIETGTNLSSGPGSGRWTSNAARSEYHHERELPSIPASGEMGNWSFNSLDSSTRSTSGEYDFPSPLMTPAFASQMSSPTLNSTPTVAIPKKQRSLGIRRLAARMMGHTASAPSRRGTPTPAHPHAHNPELYTSPVTWNKDKGRDKVYDDEMTSFLFVGAPGKKEREKLRLMIRKEMKEEKKVVKKRKLVISGIKDGEEGSGEQAVRRWCEAFGEVRAFEKRDKGCLVVDFRKASVADTVCRVQAQVYIRGAGSVNLSWCTKKGVAS